MGVGTGGCTVGATAGIRAEGGEVAVTVVEPAESPFFTEGEAGSHTIEGVGPGFRPPFLDADSYDEVIAVPERTARQYAREVVRNDGLFAGTSTGMNVAAAVKVARTRNSHDAVVTVAVDSGLKYLHGDLYQ